MSRPNFGEKFCATVESCIAVHLMSGAFCLHCTVAGFVISIPKDPK